MSLRKTHKHRQKFLYSRVISSDFGMKYDSRHPKETTQTHGTLARGSGKKLYLYYFEGITYSLRKLSHSPHHEQIIAFGQTNFSDDGIMVLKNSLWKSLAGYWRIMGKPWQNPWPEWFPEEETAVSAAWLGLGWLGGNCIKTAGKQSIHFHVHHFRFIHILNMSTLSRTTE